MGLPVADQTGNDCEMEEVSGMFDAVLLYPSARRLNNVPATSFDPSLARYDEVVQSLTLR